MELYRGRKDIHTLSLLKDLELGSRGSAEQTFLRHRTYRALDKAGPHYHVLIEHRAQRSHAPRLRSMPCFHSALCSQLHPVLGMENTLRFPRRLPQGDKAQPGQYRVKQGSPATSCCSRAHKAGSKLLRVPWEEPTVHTKLNPDLPGSFLPQFCQIPAKMNRNCSGLCPGWDPLVP